MKFHTVDIAGFKADLPILTLPSGIGIAFFNLHGDSTLTEHCGKELAKELGIHRIELNMWSFNIDALKFYEKNVF